MKIYSEMRTKHEKCNAHSGSKQNCSRNYMKCFYKKVPVQGLPPYCGNDNTETDAIQQKNAPKSGTLSYQKLRFCVLSSNCAVYFFHMAYVSATTSSENCPVWKMIYQNFMSVRQFIIIARIKFCCFI